MATVTKISSVIAHAARLLTKSPTNSTLKSTYDLLYQTLIEKFRDSADGLEVSLASLAKLPTSTSRQGVLEEELQRTSAETDAEIETLVGQLEMHSALEEKIAQATYAADLRGNGALAQGENAKALGSGAVEAKNVSGIVATGDGVRIYQLQIFPGKDLTTVDMATDKSARNYLKTLQQRANENLLPLVVKGDATTSELNIRLGQVYIELSTENVFPHTNSVTGEVSYSSYSALDSILNFKSIVLLGEPGSGKSTFIKQLAAAVAAAKLDNNKPLALGLDRDWWPFVIKLHELAYKLDALSIDENAIESKFKLLSDSVVSHIQSELTELGVNEFSELISEIFTNGNALLVFDGLDEVPEKLRPRVEYAISAVRLRFSDLRRIIVTCRTRSFTKLPGFEIFTLAPLTSEQIAKFVESWYLGQTPNRFTRAEANAKAADLNQTALSDRNLRELAGNPMLLTVITLIHQRQGSLVASRAHLYSEAVDLLVSQWQISRNLKSDDLPDELLDVLQQDGKLRMILQRLGFDAHSLQSQSVVIHDLLRKDILEYLEQETVLGGIDYANRFLNYIDKRSGILTGQTALSDSNLARSRTYGFPHRTFQEFLAGCHLFSGRQGDMLKNLRNCAQTSEHWSLPLLLGAEYLLKVQRHKEELLDIAYKLSPYHLPPTDVAQWRTTLWSGQIANLIGREEILRDTDYDGPKYLQSLSIRLSQILENNVLSAIERTEAGRVLAYVGDPRLHVTDVEEIQFCDVDAGTFWIGSDNVPQESPMKEIPFDDSFKIARFPITNAQFEQFVTDSAGYRNDTWWSQSGINWRKDKLRPEKLPAPFCLPNYPAVNLSWFEASAFTSWLSNKWRLAGKLPIGQHLRLPTEREWERAARSSTKNTYPWGDYINTELANYTDTRIQTTSAVGCFYSGRSSIGCEDLSGNTWEWCSTRWQDNHVHNPVDNEFNSAANRVIRGGAFNSSKLDIRVTRRDQAAPNAATNLIGFRVVLSKM